MMLKSIVCLTTMALSLLALTGCGALIGDSITDQSGAPMAPPLILDGYGNPAPELQQPSEMPMMQDAEENLEDTSVTIYAGSKSEAEKQCSAEAQRRSDSATIVECLGCTKMTATSNRYSCTLRIESKSAPSPEQTPGESYE
jgi:hypothetical protein